MKQRNYVAKHLHKTNRPSVEPNKKRQLHSSTLACLEEEKLCEGCFMQDKEQYQLIDELVAREEE